MLSRYSFFIFAFRFAGRYFGTPSRSRRLEENAFAQECEQSGFVRRAGPLFNLFK